MGRRPRSGTKSGSTPSCGDDDVGARRAVPLHIEIHFTSTVMVWVAASTSCFAVAAVTLISCFPLGTSLNMPSKPDRKSTRLNSSHGYISYAVFCLKKKKKRNNKMLLTFD